MRNRHLGLLVLAAAMLCPAMARAQLARCSAIGDDRERLACYDALAQRPAPTAPPSPRTIAPASAASSATPAPTAATTPATAAGASEFERRWELQPGLQQGTFKLQPYRPVYALVHATDRINNNPVSPTRSLGLQDIQLDRVEAKLQLSFKTKLAQDMLGSATDLWFGYTQQSYWQAANSRYSSPFRETDYEPEAILMHRLHFGAFGVNARSIGISLTHQSNGRGEALSRSWNRFIGDVAFESGPWLLRVRPWVRVHEAGGSHDDNPDIEDYIGRGEIVTEYRSRGQVVTLRARHTLRGGERSRGSAQLDWAFPLASSLNGHVQFFTGYGESLIDYNHRQSALGIGISFVD